MKKLWLHYRGALESCNYSCWYCPFGKQPCRRETLLEDARQVERFVSWARGWTLSRLGLFFTPSGEAAIHRHYQEALVSLSHLSHVDRVAIQTNLSGSLGWLSRSDSRRVGLWASYHPSQVSRRRFLDGVEVALAAGVQLSVGVVGLREQIGEIEALRRELPPSTYLWVNAFKRAPQYYRDIDLERLRSVDPFFDDSASTHPSLGEACWTGESVFLADGVGRLRRCHFVAEELGNIYSGALERACRPQTCPNASCGCHIGYVHLKYLGLHERFGAGLLERVPRSVLAGGARPR